MARTRSRGGSMLPWYHYIRRGYGGGEALGNDLASAGQDIGSGIKSAIQQGKANTAADTQMQAYNNINPPRADLVSVPGESVQDWQRQNPNVPTSQSTIPAPYGQGAQGMQTWIAMQNLMRAQDTAQQQAAFRGMQMARGAQAMDIARQNLGMKYQQMQGKQGQVPSADLVRMAEANSLAQRYTGLPLDAVMQHSQDWKLNADGTAYINNTLSGHYNKEISIPKADFESNWPKVSGAGVLLQKYMQTPAADVLRQQLQLQGAQINQDNTPSSPLNQGQATPQPGASLGGMTANPLSNMQSDYMKQQQNPTGASQSPVVPNPQSTGQPTPSPVPAPTPAGRQGKQQTTPADSYIQKAISGGFNSSDRIAKIANDEVPYANPAYDLFGGGGGGGGFNLNMLQGLGNA